MRQNGLGGLRAKKSRRLKKEGGPSSGNTADDPNYGRTIGPTQINSFNTTAIRTTRGLIEIMLPNSPGYQSAANRFDLCATNGTVATTVKAVGNTGGEYEEFIWSKHAILSPHRQRPTRGIMTRRHRRNPATVDDEKRSGGVYSITGTGNDGFEDIPIITGLIGSSQYIMLCTIWNAEINDPAHGRFARASHV